MHKNSIELNTMILDNLDVTIPNFEIYSARKITNPIEFLQYKVQSRISR